MAEDRSRPAKARTVHHKIARHDPGRTAGMGDGDGPGLVRPIGTFRRVAGILLILAGVGLTAGAVVGAIVDPAPKRQGREQAATPAEPTAEGAPVVPVADDGSDLSAMTPQWLAEEGEHAVAALALPQTTPMPESTPIPDHGLPAAPPTVDEDPTAVGEGDAPPWRRYAVAAAMPDDRPKIALIIDDLGLNRARADRTIALPGPLTLAFLPYAHGLKEQTASARAAGHELLVHMPMEPMGAANPGPDALLTSLDAGETEARLARNLSHFGAYVGINNHMGSAATSDPALMKTVLADVKRRGLLFVDSRTSAKSVAGSIAREMGIPTVDRDVFLDHKIERGAIEAALAKLERIARETGIAIGIGHPHPATLSVLEQWLPEAKARGVVFVPISAVAAEEETRLVQR